MPTDGLDDTIITATAAYSINFSKPRKKFYLSLHYNVNNSFLFVNGVNIYQFKTKKADVNTCPLFLQLLI